MRISKAGKSGLLRLAVVAAATGALAWAGASRGAESSASPLKLRFGGDAASTRVVLELSQAASAEVVSNGAGDGHVILDFSRLTVGDSLDGQGKGLVKAWAIDKSHGHTRLSLDLNGRGHVRRRFLLPPSDGVSIYRYVMDIEADGGPAAKQPAPAPRAQVAEAAPPPTVSMPVSADLEAPAANARPAVAAVTARRRKTPLLPGQNLRILRRHAFVEQESEALW